MSINLFEKTSKFTFEEGKKIQKYYWKDKEFRNKFNSARNAWLLQKISVKKAMKIIKDELKKAEKREKQKIKE
jgi:hypothetical protein